MFFIFLILITILVGGIVNASGLDASGLDRESTHRDNSTNSLRFEGTLTLMLNKLS